MGGRPLPDIIINEVVRMRLEGKTFTYIAKALDITPSGAQSAFSRAAPNATKVEDRPPRNNIPSIEVDKMFEKEYGEADIRRLWKVLQGTSRIEREQKDAKF